PDLAPPQPARLQSAPPREAVARTPHTGELCPQTDTAFADPRSFLPRAGTVPEFSATVRPPYSSSRTAPEFLPGASDPAASRRPRSALSHAPALPLHCCLRKSAPRSPGISHH